MDLNLQGSFKELYSVSLKSTYPMEIKGVHIEEGETIAAFNEIQLANFDEIKSHISANGGFDNRAHVSWDTTKEIQLSFTQGVFSQTQFALMNNSKLLEISKGEAILISQLEEKESNEEGIIEFSHTPVGKFFIYDKQTGLKIISPIKVDETHYKIDSPFKTIVLDYCSEYTNGAETMVVGRELTSGYLSFEGRTRIKDDSDGNTKTAIIKIPKLKLMSGLSIRLGKNSNPVTGRLMATAYPVGTRGISTVADIIYLNDDIDSDM